MDPQMCTAAHTQVHAIRMSSCTGEHDKELILQLRRRQLPKHKHMHKSTDSSNAGCEISSVLSLHRAPQGKASGPTADQPLLSPWGGQGRVPQ